MDSELYKEFVTAHRKAVFWERAYKKESARNRELVKKVLDTCSKAVAAEILGEDEYLAAGTVYGGRG